MIEITKNDVNFIVFNITSAYDNNGNKLSSLSGINFRMHARRNINDANYLFQKTSGNGITINNMEVVVKVSPPDLSSLSYYDVFYIDLQAEVGGESYNVYCGKQPIPVKIIPEVTR